MPPRTEVVEYHVTSWPEDLPDPEERYWRVSVHRTRIPDMWAVTHLGDWPILTKRGNWSYKMPRSLRGSCYMPLDEALAAAEKAAESLTINGWTLSDAVDAAAHRARVQKRNREDREEMAVRGREHGNQI